MLKIELPGPHPVFEPTPRFASDAEVAFAQWLRHQLEQRYLARSEVAAQLGEVH